MFFDELLSSGNELICVKDVYGCSGRWLLKDIAIGAAIRKRHVYIFSCDILSCRHRNGWLGQSYQDHLHFFPLRPQLLSDEVPYTVLSCLKNMSPRTNPLTFIIDSLSSCLLHQNFSDLYKELNTLLTRKILPGISEMHIVALIHDDTLGNKETVIEHLKRLSKVWVNVDSKDQLTVSTVRGHLGKLSEKQFLYKVSDDGTVSSKQLIQKKDASQSRNAEKQLEDNRGVPPKHPVSTFKLTLTDQEKVARQNVKLPFTRNTDENADSSSGMSTGKIFYEPDEFDDWDDEEPDEEF